MDLTHRSDEQLLLDVGRLVGSHRVLTAKLVVHLAEIEERRLHVRAGFPSMFEFCVRELGFSEGEAFRRILAARLFARFPVVYALLASGKVHLSALELLREHLTEANHGELFQAASGMSKREVEAYLAARFPRPDVPSRITRARIEPLSETRFKVEFTARAELREKLELCLDLLSHANPSRDLAVVIERAIDLLIDDLQRKRLARTKRSHKRVVADGASGTGDGDDGTGDAENGKSNAGVPGGNGAGGGASNTRRRAANSRATPRRVQNAARREVFERDGLGCTYVSPGGRRCSSRAFLELDHAHPRALGGADSAENLRVRCRAHNQHSAEQVFGREHMELSRSRHLRQQKSHGEDDPSQRTKHGAQPSTAPSIWNKVAAALVGMGFRVAETRRVVLEVRGKHSQTPPLELALREGNHSVITLKKETASRSATA